MKSHHLNHRLLGVILVLSATVEVCAQTAPAATNPRPSDAAKPAGQLTRAPRLKQFVSAELPAESMPNAVTVMVGLELAIDAEGKVLEASVKESAGAPFDAAAVAAAKQFLFEPAEIDHQPAGVRVGYRYDFSKIVAAAPVAPASSVFTGVVRNRKTKAPLVDVQIEVDGEAGITTDAHGRFTFDAIEPGNHTVFIKSPGLTPLGTEESISPATKYEAVYEIEVPEAAVAPKEAADFELVVFAPRLDRKVASTEVAAEQGARVAGTGGDAVKVVENLPGVARTAVGSGALVVWGASAQDTRVYVDAVRLPVLYHEGGFRSVIHSDLVRSVELQPGGYGSNYGRGLGGLVTVGLRPLEAGGYHGSAGADLIDASASVRGNIGDKVRFALAGRKSHLDWVLRQVTTEDPGQFVPIPKYWDGQARMAYVPREGETFEVGTLASHDQIERIRVSSDPGDTRREQKTTEFQRYYGRYRRELGEGSSVTATPWFGFDRVSVANLVGSIPATQESRASLVGTRIEWVGKLSARAVLDVGVDAELVTTRVNRLGSLTTPAREGDIRVFGQPPSNQVAADRWSTTSAGIAPFFQVDLSPFGEAFHIIPGVRFEPLVARASRGDPSNGVVPARGVEQMSAPLDPRLAMRWQITKRMLVKGAFGIYHQPPFAEDMSAVFGNPRLGLSRANHYLAGGNFQLSEPLTIELTSFYSSMSGITVRNPTENPLAAQALLGSGEGRAYGSQFMLRHNPVGRFFGWVSLSIIRSERRDPITFGWRPFDFDQTYTLTVVGSYDLGNGFEVGARARWASGYPRTPVIGASGVNAYDELSYGDRYQPRFGAINSSRIPNFYQIDVRATKKFKLGKDSGIEVYLDVQNVTNHSNPEEVVYNYNYSKKSYITGLPILPVLGAKLTW